MAENVPALAIKACWQMMVICRQLEVPKDGVFGVLSRH